MAELSIVPKGAVLIRNGIVEEINTARRVENLAGARHAREIDATDRIVMPAFVDADVALVMPSASGEKAGHDIRLMSRKRILARAAAASREYAAYGCLTIGAHTRIATDLSNIRRLLQVHRVLEKKPSRIRSIFAPVPPAEGTEDFDQFPETLQAKWLPAVMSRKLASAVELAVAGPDDAADMRRLRAMAEAAHALGYCIRMRSSCPLREDHLKLAESAGMMATIGPMDDLHALTGKLSRAGVVRVIPASEGFDSDAEKAARSIRGAIERGAAIALTSSYRGAETSSVNMQYLLHLAVHRLGFTPEEAITATTWNAACALRMSRVCGSIEPGKPADLLVMDVPDYRELPRRAGHRDVSLVMREGRIVFRNSVSSGSTGEDPAH